MKMKKNVVETDSESHDGCHCFSFRCVYSGKSQ